VPFQPGRLLAVATRQGQVVARDEIDTAGPAARLTLTPGPRALPADGTSLAFLAVEVTDRAGVLVPSASHPIQFSVSGPAVIAGVDNGQQENPQSYHASAVPAFNGRALVIVASTREAGRITVTATSPGLAPARVTLRSAPQASRRGQTVSVASAAAVRAAGGRESAGSGSLAATADASYSGAPGTLPAAMLDGDPSTGWSNYYVKSATANLHAVSVSRPGDWVSITWPQPQSFDSVVAYFTTSAKLALPASIQVSYWDGRGFVPVANLAIDWATASSQPTTLTFDPVRRGSALRLDLTSAAPGTGGGFLMIAELQVLSHGVNIG